MKKTKTKSRQVYYWYLVLALVYSFYVLGINFFLAMIDTSLAWLTVTIALIWLAINVTVLIAFFTEKMNKKAIIVPILYIFDFFFSLGSGTMIGLLATGGVISYEVMEVMAAVVGSTVPAIALIFVVKFMTKSK